MKKRHSDDSDRAHKRGKNTRADSSSSELQVRRGRPIKNVASSSDEEIVTKKGANSTKKGTTATSKK